MDCAFLEATTMLGNINKVISAWVAFVKIFCFGDMGRFNFSRVDKIIRSFSILCSELRH